MGAFNPLLLLCNTVYSIIKKLFTQILVDFWQGRKYYTEIQIYKIVYDLHSYYKYFSWEAPIRYTLQNNYCIGVKYYITVNNYSVVGYNAVNKRRKKFPVKIFFKYADCA